MFNFLKKWFTKKSVIDQLIELTDPVYLQIWNGVDFNMNYCIPMTSRKPRTWQDNNFQWIRLAFGSYAKLNSSENTPMIEIWINSLGHIVRTSRNHPYVTTRKIRHFENQLDKLYDKLQDERVVRTNIPKLLDWIGGIFSLDPKYRYGLPIMYSDILRSNYSALDDILENYACYKEGKSK